ncbi:MAG: rRNA maturation RNase YbeY [Burkholderiales bacterium]
MPRELRLSVQDATKGVRLPSRTTLRRWIAAALRRPAEITLRFVGTAEGRRLNRDYRGRDYATNVLTFAYSEHPALAGDIVVCVPVAKREAAELGITLYRHCAHLIVHGTLHMQGYDHEQDQEAEKMEALETRIMKSLGYPGPYAAPAG